MGQDAGRQMQEMATQTAENIITAEVGEGAQSEGDADAEVQKVEAAGEAALENDEGVEDSEAWQCTACSVVTAELWRQDGTDSWFCAACWEKGDAAEPDATVVEPS